MKEDLTITNRKHPRILPPIATVKGLILATCLFTIPVTLQSCGSSAQSVNITGAKNMQFRFEDYKTAEAAQKKLLELYPVGSDVSKFDKDMQSLGYERIPSLTGLKILGFQHLITINAAGGDTWYLSIYYNDDNKITKLTVNKSFTSL